MNIVEQATSTQLKNIQQRTGKTLEELYVFIRQSGLVRHGEICEMLKRELGVGHGDANTLVTFYLKSLQEQSVESSLEELVAEIYSGSRASLHPIHDAVMKAVSGFGEFEIVPKKGYLSLRRKRWQRSYPCRLRDGALGHHHQGKSQSDGAGCAFPQAESDNCVCDEI